MSSQSLGRSKRALQMSRCSAARIGRRASGRGTVRVWRRMASWRSSYAKKRSIGVRPQRLRHWPSRCTVWAWIGSAPRGASASLNGGVLCGCDEHVDVYVDRRARLGVVGQRQRAAEGVRDLGGGEAAVKCVIFSGREGSLMLEG